MSEPVTGPSPDVAATVEAALAAHRFSATREQDGTLDYGWCAGGDSYSAKHISEHEAHVAQVVAAALAETPRPAEPEQNDRDELHRVLSAAPDHGGWRAGMDDDDYLALADAVLVAGFARAPQPERAARDHGLQERVEWNVRFRWGQVGVEGPSREGRPLTRSEALSWAETHEGTTLLRRTVTVTEWEPVLADDAADTDSEAGQ